jgi:phenylalanyl-tRNA synthetase beta chain
MTFPFLRMMLIYLFFNFLNEDPTFFPGRAATIYYRTGPTAKTKLGTDLEIGRLGILHPSVLERFEIGYPCSALEFSLEPFKAEVPTMWTNDDI